MKRLREILRRIDQGATEAILCRADDGKQYVVKTRRSGCEAMVKEWLCASIGMRLGLPIPAVELVYMPSAAAQYSVYAEAGALADCPGFGSELVEPADLLTPAAIGAVPELASPAIVAGFVPHPARTGRHDFAAVPYRWVLGRNMTELLCNYAILRFLPYKEIGEFINVGVVLHCPEINFLDYRLAPTRNPRVRLFFPELDSAVYKAGVQAIGRELARLRSSDGLFSGRAVKPDEIGRGLTLFRNLLQRREALFNFAAPGTLLAEPRGGIQELYQRYVQRRFAHERGYQERAMQHRLAKWMRQWGLREKYQKDVRLGDDMFHLTLPFVHSEQGVPITAIKTLDLDRREPTDVFDHGDLWAQRIRRLCQRHHAPRQTIFAIRLPVAPSVSDAAVEVVNAFESLSGVKWVPFEETERLRQSIAV